MAGRKRLRFLEEEDAQDNFLVSCAELLGVHVSHGNKVDGKELFDQVRSQKQALESARGGLSYAEQLLGFPPDLARTLHPGYKIENWKGRDGALHVRVSPEAVKALSVPQEGTIKYSQPNLAKDPILAAKVMRIKPQYRTKCLQEISHNENPARYDPCDRMDCPLMHTDQVEFLASGRYAIELAAGLLPPWGSFNKDWKMLRSAPSHRYISKENDVLSVLDWHKRAFGH